MKEWIQEIQEQGATALGTATVRGEQEGYVSPRKFLNF